MVTQIQLTCVAFPSQLQLNDLARSFRPKFTAPVDHLFSAYTNWILSFCQEAKGLQEKWDNMCVPETLKCCPEWLSFWDFLFSAGNGCSLQIVYLLSHCRRQLSLVFIWHPLLCTRWLSVTEGVSAPDVWHKIYPGTILKHLQHSAPYSGRYREIRAP